MSVLNVANLRKKYGYMGTCNVLGVAMCLYLVAVGVVLWPRLIICTDLTRHVYA